MAAFGIDTQPRHVIVYHGTVHSGFFIGQQRLHGVCLALVDERFRERRYRTRNESEMNVVDLFALSEIPNGIEHVAWHLGYSTLTETQAVAVAGDDVDESLQRFVAAKNPGDSTDGRDRRVIGVQAHAHPGAFGRGYDRLQKIGNVVPHVFVGEFEVPGNGPGTSNPASLP